MLRSIKIFFLKQWEFVKPFLVRHFAAGIFVGGVFLLFYSSTLPDEKSTFLFGYEIKRISEVLSKLSSAILGAGVFAVIMKSHQFTKIFKRHIATVFYDPANADIDEELEKNWELITSSLLASVVPSTHEEAAKQIKDLFLKDDQDYHLENFRMSLDINIDPSTLDATIVSVVRSYMVISKNITTAPYEPTIKTDGTFKQDYLLFDGKPVQHGEEYKVVSGQPNLHKLEVDLVDYNGLNGDEGRIYFERKVTFSQNLTNDPLLIGRISRYVKGLSVRAKVSSEHKLEFARFGPTDLPSEAFSTLDDGRSQWVLGDSSSLLLPGQGYIICIVPV